MESNTLVISCLRSDHYFDEFVTNHLLVQPDTHSIPITRIMEQIERLSISEFQSEFAKFDRFSFQGHPQNWFQNSIRLKGLSVGAKFPRNLTRDQIAFYKLSDMLPFVICEDEERVALFHSFNIISYSYARFYNRILKDFIAYGILPELSEWFSKGIALEGNLQKVVGGLFRALGKSFVPYSELTCKVAA